MTTLNPNLNPDAGIVLLSYWSLHLTARTDKPHADMPMSPTSLALSCLANRQASHRPALRPDKPRADTPTNLLTSLATSCPANRQASCRYAYEPDPTSLAPICPANLTSPRADTPTTPTTCHADMPVTRTRLGRASLPRFPWPDGAWLPGIRPSLALYCHCDLINKTPRRYTYKTN